MKDYYRNNRDELKVKARDKYRELSEEEKDIRRQYGRNRYNNMSEEDKKRLKEYQRNYRRSITRRFFTCIFFSMYKMGKELVFHTGHNSYYINKYYFQK